ncbi:MAG: F0F1 ATP synthase subunit epsilon [Clostridia bacterium]|nr:F0F1 ATP synthase subunit epsilon [Clostridia bacterium]
MAEKVLTMEVVTPERHVLTTDTNGIVVPAHEGYLGVLYNHAPLVTILDTGILRYSLDGKVERMAVCGGFMEVDENKIIILADTAELAEEIDVARAMDSKRRAEDRLRQMGEKVDEARAQASLQRAIARIKASGKE